MIAADRQRNNPARDQLAEKGLDIGMALFQSKARGKRHVANIGGVQILRRRTVEHMIVRADTFDASERTRTETRARTVGHPQIHRHADNGDLQVAGFNIRAGIVIGKRKKGRQTGIGRNPGTT